MNLDSGKVYCLPDAGLPGGPAAQARRHALEGVLHPRSRGGDGRETTTGADDGSTVQIISPARWGSTRGARRITSTWCCSR